MGKDFKIKFKYLIPLLIITLTGNLLFGQERVHELKVQYISRTTTLCYFSYEDDIIIQSGDELVIRLSESQTNRAVIKAVSSKYIAVQFVGEPSVTLQKTKSYNASKNVG